MDFFWIFLLVVVIACVFLDVMATSMIRASQIHDAARKRKLLLILWCLPMLGVFIVVRQINRDIKVNQAKMEEQIAPAIREVADRLKVLDADLSQKRAEQINQKIQNKSTKIH